MPAALEFFGGRSVQKCSGGLVRSILLGEIMMRLHEFARSRELGGFCLGLRCTFGGVSLVPDLCYFARGRLPKMVRGEEYPDVLIPPDLAVQILSPGQPVAELRMKLRRMLKHGTKLGWLIYPKREKVLVFRADREVEVLRVGETLFGEDVLPGFFLPIDEIILRLRKA